MIEVQNISKSYADIQALNNVSFGVNRGELFGLIGPDGAGKTSLMRILATLLVPDEGSVCLAGINVVKDYRKIRQMVGYMPGRFSLYPDLTVEENLAFFATVFGTSVAENYDLIRDIYVQIEPFKNRLAGKLSGGMKQKLALSCALIHKPEVLILDEPTTGVDAVSRKEFWEMLRKLQQDGMSILVSTPYMDEAGLCDRVALMQKGEILTVESPTLITGKYKRLLLAVSSDNRYRLICDLREWTKTNTVYAFGQFLHFTSKQDEVGVAEMERYLLARNHKRFQVLEIAPGIEDVFMDLMRNEQA
ncbi:MAG: ABC transporter ATP-binding protein [Mangrovibacterium sp.]